MAATAARRHRGVRRALFVTAVGLGCLLAWLGWRVLTVKSELEAIAASATQVRSAIASEDLAALAGLAGPLAESAARASAAANDPVWRAAELVPWLGTDLRAVRVVSEQAAQLAPHLATASDAIARLMATEPGSLVDVSALSQAAPALTGLSTALDTASAALTPLRGRTLLPPVREGLAAVCDAIESVRPLLSSSAHALTVVPAMLGAAGPRSILLMVQNTAEPRTGGGITGTFAEMRAESGRLSLIDYADSALFAPRTDAIIAVPESTTLLYTDVVGRYVQNASMPTDFAVTARLAAAWWDEYTGHSPDTVVSVDPAVLQALLQATGPVTLASGQQLSADNVVDSLLVVPYATLEPDAQTALYRDAISAVLSRALDGGVDPLALVRALAAPAAVGHLAIWNARPDENAAFAGGPLGGPAARLDAAGPGAFGVFFNDATGGKMAPYLTTDIEVVAGSCASAGMQNVVVTVTLSSHAPHDVESLSRSLSGAGIFGVAVGDIGTNVSVSGPKDAFLAGVDVKGAPYPAVSVVDDGRPATAARVNLSPDEVNEIDFRFLVPVRSAADLAIVHTPLLNEPSVRVEDNTCAAGEVSASTPSR